MSTPLTFPRLYADQSGVSHFAPLEIEVSPHHFAPPAPPFSVSAMAPANRVGFLHLASGWVGDLHPSPLRMWVFVLSGQMEFEAGDGERCQVGAGSVLFLEDTEGSGHCSRVVGNAPAILAVVHV